MCGTDLPSASARVINLLSELGLRQGAVGRPVPLPSLITEPRRDADGCSVRYFLSRAAEAGGGRRVRFEARLRGCRGLPACRYSLHPPLSRESHGEISLLISSQPLFSCPNAAVQVIVLTMRLACRHSAINMDDANSRCPASPRPNRRCESAIDWREPLRSPSHRHGICSNVTETLGSRLRSDRPSALTMPHCPLAVIGPCILGQHCRMLPSGFFERG